MGKKKGAKNKLARMSEEERARYLQHRADMEEEARRRKQQLIALYMKNKLKREEAFSRLNLAKINQEWRYILRQIKCQEFRNEIIDVERHFRDAFDQKNRIINRLLNDLDEAEDLYSTLQQAHAQNIQSLIGLHSKRLNFWKGEYIKEKGDILNEYQKDFDNYREARERSQKNLECVYFALQDIAESREAESEEKHQQMLDDVKSKMTIKLETITQSRENHIEQLWKQYQNVLDNYMQYTDTFNAEYNNLRERDDYNTKLIRKHCNEIVRASDLIVELKIQAENAVEEHEFRVNYLEAYRNKLNQQYLQLKRNLESALRSDRSNFKYMVVTSEGTLKVMRNIVKRGEGVLQLAAACRRLESEREKILPFGESSPPQTEERPMRKSVKDPYDLKEVTLDMWYNLENFWIRVNNARIDCACLNEEKTTLERENANLKAQFKEYLIKVTLETGTGGRAEDRLINRPSSMKVEKVVQIDLDDGNGFSRGKSQKRRPVTCIEGNLSNAVRASRMMRGKSNAGRIRSMVNNW